MWEVVNRIAHSYAEEYQSDAIYPSHLFKAILHKEVGLVDYIETELKKDYYYLQEWADMQMQLSPKAVNPLSMLELSDECKAVFDEAENYKEQFFLDETNAICLLASLVTPGVGFTFDQLKTLPLNANEISAKFNGGVVPNTAGGSHIVVPDTAKYAPGADNRSNIEKFCISKNKEALSGKIPPVIGFESEISIIYEVLGRKTKSNLLITGESGVGKTSLVNGFVLQLISERAPSFLSKAVVYEVDLASLSADASYKGEVEDRFKKLVQEIKSVENAILLIESIDKIFDKQSNLFGASTILKQELSKGNLLLICTASIDGFTKNIETDKEFTSKLERIALDEPNADTSLRILKGAISVYEKYHKLTIGEPVMVDAIRLAKRYMTEKSLPDSAFDLIDRTMALIRTMNDLSTKQLSDFKVQLEELKDKKEVLGEANYMKELEWLNSALFSKISCILLAQLDTDIDFLKIPTSEERVTYLENTMEQLWAMCEKPKEILESSDISAVVAKETGIPLGKVQSKERDRLVNGEKTLKERVIGQDHAVKIVLDAVFESRSGLKKKGQPMGAFFFLGPTGTGKTELSKALAAFLFEDESSLIRFDMSEFKEEHSVALLYGAPPGYVGYEEGGLLVNKIRQKPYSVVLFDEIEKAHKSVFDLFLQIVDEGKLHDRLGRVGDFSNALILFTSNIGSKFIVDSFGKGEIPKNNDLMSLMQNHFRPEFLGRLTEIIPFAPITEEMITRIFEIHLKELLKLLDEQNITLNMSQEVKREIAMMGYNPEYGARPVIGIIRQKLRRPLSKLIISGELKSGNVVDVKVDNGEVKFEVNK